MLFPFFALLVLLEDFALGAPRFLELAARPELLVVLALLHKRVVVDASLMVHLILEAYFSAVGRARRTLLERPTQNVALFQPFKRLLRKVKLAIAPDAQRVLMVVDATLVQVYSGLFLLPLLLVRLHEVVVHEFCVSPTAAYNLGLLVLIFLFLVAFQRLVAHALQHFVRDLDFASVVLLYTALLLGQTGRCELLHVLEHSFKVAFV